MSKNAKDGEDGGRSVMRCFVAVDVASPSLRRSLEAAQLGLRRAFGPNDPVKWVAVHQLHVTMKFLGEIPEEAALRAGEAMGRAAAALPPFDVRIAGLGAFPSPERPSVIWAGVGAGKAELVRLASLVEAQMEAEAFPRERRPFQAHLTLGRVREGARVPAAAVQALAEAAGRDYGGWRVDRLLLMRSELTPRGPIYSVLKAVPLSEENT